MNHDRAKHLLYAYADRQIGIMRRFFLRRHVTGCPSCLAELETIQATRSALRTNLPMHRAPPALAARIASALPREMAPPIPRQRLHFGFAGGSLAGGLAGVALTLAVTRVVPPADPLVADVVADHVRSMMADHLTDVPTSDQHTVKPWLSARLDLSPVVKDFVAEGYPLIGGRLDYVDGHRAAAIVYRRDKHVINLFAFVANDRSDAPLRLDTRDGFNVVRWRTGGLSYVAVSDVEAAQLLAFVHLVESG
ncbi:anti-sigma factor [Acidisphaera sp. S103]|uniref:anti-sigma factor family protein n=1 Tax=Acidisphaera sp. S103 TaxID=1747223 RepID=UPI00131D5263|nr:anti-sigma factor [Acidisphaera sp. S103]